MMMREWIIIITIIIITLSTIILLSPSLLSLQSSSSSHTQNNIADKDNSGQISRAELAAELNMRTTDVPELKRFLDKVAASKGLDMGSNGSGDDDGGGGAYDALFDMVEGTYTTYCSYTTYSDLDITILQ